MDLSSIVSIDAISKPLQDQVKVNPSGTDSYDSLKTSLQQSLSMNEMASNRQLMHTREVNRYMESLHNQKQADFNRKYGKSYTAKLNDQAKLVGVAIPDVLAQFKPGHNLLTANVLNVKYQTEALSTQIHHISDLISKSKTVIDKLASNG